MGTSRLGLGALASCLLAAISPAAAETFILTNGSVVEGTVVRALGKTLSIKYPGAGMMQLPIKDVQRVEIAKKEGGVISGQIISWSKGVYRLSTQDGPLEAVVEGGQVVALVGAEGAVSNTDRQAPAETAALSAPAVEPTPPASRAINAGFVYVGSIDDGGRTFMHERGRQELGRNPLIDETAFLELASESNDQVVYAVDQLVADGANVVFMTGNDSTAAVLEASKRHEDVRFVHCGSSDPTANISVLCGRIYQARYLTGMIAGAMTVVDSIGYVAAEPTPRTIVEINAFALGAQSINPNAKVVVHWSRSWYGPGDAQQRAIELIDRGVDVLTIHQDSPAALQVAEQRGVNAIGYQSDMSAFAPSTILTSAIWDWGEMYNQIVDSLSAGGADLRPKWLGLREGVVGLAPLSSRVPDQLRRLVQQRQQELVDGRFHVFTGPIRDVDGDVRVLDGRIMTDESLQKMDYLIEGVVGY